MNDIEFMRDNFIAIVTHKNRVNGFKLLDKLGLLQQIIPEFEATKKMRAGNLKYHPESDIFTHTIAALDYLRNDASLELILAVLLHDIGKPTTFNNYHFREHDKVGAEIARDILTRLKFDSEVIESVVWLVSNHMRVRKIDIMKESKQKQLIDHPLFNELHRLVMADIMISEERVIISDMIQKQKNKLYYRR